MKFTRDQCFQKNNYMIIGIHSLAAFKPQRTGVEEYVFQLFRKLLNIDEAKKHRFLLYSSFKNSEAEKELGLFGSENFRVKILRFPVMWTQIRLAFEMAVKKPDALFIPAHVLPFIHPKNSIVTIHDLYYEYFPKAYPFFHQRYLRWTTKYALFKAKKIIVPSESTKKDLIELYGGDPKKIKVIYHGFAPFIVSDTEKSPLNQKYILYIGRIERKKNIEGLIKGFELAKEKYRIPHKLALIGGPGHLYEEIIRKINVSPVKQDIILTGYLDEKQKNIFLKFADIFAFPSFFEGFGFPVLEAQFAQIPVITSNVSCLLEIAGKDGAILIDPKNSEEIAEAIHKSVNDNKLRDFLIKNGLENIKRFGWEKCARETLQTIIE